MTLKVLAFALFTRLYTRFGLEPIPPGVPHLAPALTPTIVPTTDADKLFESPSSDGGLEDFSVSTYVTFATVPQGERWTLVHLEVVATTGSVQLAVEVAAGGTPRAIQEALAAYKGYFGAPLTLDEGGSIGAFGGGNGADTSRGWSAHFIISDAF